MNNYCKVLKQFYTANYKYKALLKEMEDDRDVSKVHKLQEQHQTEVKKLNDKIIDLEKHSAKQVPKLEEEIYKLKEELGKSNKKEK